MGTGKAILYALGITVVSAILLTATNGVPTVGQAVPACLVMFLLSFFVLKQSKS